MARSEIIAEYNRLLHLEQACWAQPARFATLVIGLAALSVAIDLFARRQPSAPAEALDEVASDEADVTVLSIRTAEPRAVLGGREAT